MTTVLELRGDPSRVADGRSVLFSETALESFLSAAAKEYASITPDEPRPCFGVLLGTGAEGAFLVERIEFGRNARGRSSRPPSCPGSARRTRTRCGRGSWTRRTCC